MSASKAVGDREEEKKGGGLGREGKAWFPYDRPDRPDRPSRFKIFRDDPNDWVIGSFHMIVSIASKARDTGSSAISLGQTIEFLGVFCKQAT